MQMDSEGLGVGPTVPPAERRRKERRGSRVVIVSPEGRTLLTERFDPGLPDSGWWTTPGGGVDPGEDDRTAAVRELWEETGQRVAPEDLAGPVAHRITIHGYSDQIARQEEVFFVWDAPAEFAVAPQVITERESVSTRESRWWPLAELDATQAWVWDPVVELWELRDQPQRWPVELGTVELSTVPVEQG